MRLALAAAALACAACAACSTPAKQPPVIGSSGGDDGSALPVVADGAALEANAGTTVEVHGKGENAKIAAAMVTTDGVVIYCLGVDDWGANRDRAVAARGKLERTAEFTAAPDPNGEISAGTSDPVWVLRDCQVVDPVR